MRRGEEALRVVGVEEAGAGEARAEGARGRWWRELAEEETDPISLEPLARLCHAPFGLPCLQPIGAALAPLGLRIATETDPRHQEKNEFEPLMAGPAADAPRTAAAGGGAGGGEGGGWRRRGKCGRGSA